jgi:zinc transport system substrate-binding protein
MALRDGAAAGAVGFAACAILAAALLGHARADKVRLAATIFPLYDIAREVAGPMADVALILPPGASRHTFEPTPAAVRALGGAQALFVVGHGLDAWAARLAGGAGVSRLVRVDGDIALRRVDGAVDPHYWLSAPNARAIAGVVAAELERLAPDRYPEIQRSLLAYQARLDAADAEVRRLLADLPSRRIATVHEVRTSPCGSPDRSGRPWRRCRSRSPRARSPS